MMSCGNLKKTRRIFPYVFGVCLLAVLIPYFDSLRGEFVFDDEFLIQRDPFYVNESNPIKCWERDFFWQGNMKQGLYRPFTLFSYWINAKISGIYSPAFRIGNLIIHFLVTLLVFKLALRLRFGHWVAIFAAVLFAVHPIHTEAVIPAFGRGELLCALFLLCALIIHTSTERNKLLYIASGICFLFACWSKEHGLAFLPLCVLVDLYLKHPVKVPQLKELIKKKSGIYLFYISIVIVFFASRYYALGTLIPSKANFNPATDNPIALCQFPLNVISALKVQGLALSKFFWPAVLSHDYSYAQLLPSVSLFDWKAWLTVILFLGIPAFICVTFEKLKFKIIFLLMAYAVCVIPAGNFIIMTGTIFGERLQYIPSIWLCIFSAITISLMFKILNFKAVLVICAAIIIAASVRTYERGKDWDNQISIATAGVRSAPMSFKTWHNLAVQFANTNSLKEAVMACDRAISIYPSSIRTLLNRASYNIKLGNFDSAEKDLKKLILLGKANTEVYNKLGAILANRGKFEEALESWRISLQLDGKQPTIKNAVDDLKNEMNQEEKKK